MRSKILLLIYILFAPYGLYAQSNQESIDRSLFTFTMGLNTNDAYDLELSYHFMLSRYCGIGGGVGYFRQWYNECLPSGEAYGKWNSWVLSESDRKVGKVYFHPSVLLSSPTLFTVSKYDFLLTGTFGVQILIPYSGLSVEYVNSNTYDSKSEYISTTQGDCFFWSAKGGMTLRAYSSSFSIGYGISSLDIYSSRRTFNVENTSLSNFYPIKKVTHSLFFSFGYFF